ncbi:MAG: sensor histidine kinase [Maricaulaceae bacterium]|nr:sensor histidine kinase [Maricaulaceae bacterium]
MTRRSSSLVLRLVAGAAVWTVALLIAGAVALTALYRDAVLRTLDDRLESVVTALVAGAEIDADGELDLIRAPSDPRYDQVFSGRYWQLSELRTNPDGKQVAEALLRSRSLWDETLEPPSPVLDAALEQPGALFSAEATGPDDEPLRLRVQAVRLSGHDTLLMVIAAEDRRPADRDVRRFGFIAAAMFFVFAAALAAGVIFQVRIGLAPLFRMRKSVAEVREGRAERLEDDYPAELHPLATELNSLLDHSREVVERARTHVGNLAHALKTPIAVLVNESRSQTGELAELVGRQADVMARQVDHHLRRARAAAHAKAVGARTDAAQVLSDLSRTLQRIYAKRDVTVEVECPPELLFRGETQDFEEMAGNLMDNACKWAGSMVRVTARREGAVLTVDVDDDGPGMDQDAIALALRRGVRLDEQAPGAGLGLSIVDDLARAYEGDLVLGRSALGGLHARLILPAAGS